jgi:peroxiredoxin
MRTALLSAAVSLAIAVGFVSSAAAQTSVSAGGPTEEQFRQMMFADAEKVTYFDANGKQIDYNTFVAQMMNRVGFDKKIDKETNTATVTLHSSQTASPQISETQFREQTLLDDVKQVTYIDTDGRQMDFNAFIAKMRAGGGITFDKVVNKEKGTATMTLQASKTDSPPPSGQSPKQVQVQLQKIPEAQFLEKLMLGDDAKVTYIDTDGKQIGYDTFADKLASDEVAYTKQVDEEKNTATATLMALPAGMKKRLEDVLQQKQAARQQGNSPSPIAVGNSIPVLGHASLDGKRFNLADGEHYSLLSFYFAECVPCIQEIPELNKLRAESPGLQTISITFDDKAAAQEFIAKRGLQWPVVSDARDYITQLGVEGFPTLIAVSPEGKVLGVRSGYAISGDREKQLADLKAWLDSVGVKR